MPEVIDPALFRTTLDGSLPDKKWWSNLPATLFYFLTYNEVIFIAKNQGKLFEEDIKSSVPKTCWIYRLRDNASSFSGGSQTRFTSSNICDYIVYDDLTKTLFLLELKSTKNTSISLNMIRKNQIEGLSKAGKHNLVAGLIFNYRNENNDTFFMNINNFINMINNIGKKSFNVKDLQNYNAIRIDCHKKRTRYQYDINKMIGEISL